MPKVVVKGEREGGLESMMMCGSGVGVSVSATGSSGRDETKIHAVA
jgi:hypothetical protein